MEHDPDPEASQHPPCVTEDCGGRAAHPPHLNPEGAPLCPGCAADAAGNECTGCGASLPSAYGAFSHGRSGKPGECLCVECFGAGPERPTVPNPDPFGFVLEPAHARELSSVLNRLNADGDTYEGMPQGGVCLVSVGIGSLMAGGTPPGAIREFVSELVTQLEALERDKGNDH